MYLHSYHQAPIGFVIVLLLLGGDGAERLFAQGKTEQIAQARARTRRKSSAPSSENEVRADGYVEEGLRHADEKNWAEAVKSYKLAVGINPRHADAHINMGDAYMSMGKYEEAFAAYKAAIRVAPWNPEAHYSLGAAYNDMAMYGDAFKPFVQAINLKSDHIEAHYGIGYAYLKLENYKEALGYLKKAVRLQPFYAEAHLSLGLTYLGLKQIKAAEAQLKVLEEMDELLARELNKEMRGDGAARTTQQPKPVVPNRQDEATRGLVVSAQPSKGEPVVQTPQQNAAPTPRGKTRKTEDDPATPARQPVKSASPQTSTSDSASLLTVELSFWDSIKDSTNPEEFAAYLNKYPEGQFAELARIRQRILIEKRTEAGRVEGEQRAEAPAVEQKRKAADESKSQEATAEQPQQADGQPTQTIAAPAVQPLAEPSPTPNPLTEALRSLRNNFPNKFTYKTTAPGEEANVASITSDVVIDYEPLQFDDCLIEWRDLKDTLSVLLSDLDPLGLKVEMRSKPNTLFSIVVWNLSLTTTDGKPSIREIKGDGSGAVNTYNALDLQFDNKERAEELTRLLQQAIKLCANRQVN